MTRLCNKCADLRKMTPSRALQLFLATIGAILLAVLIALISVLKTRLTEMPNALTTSLGQENARKLIDASAARYGEKKDPAVRDEIEHLNQRLAEFRHLAILEDALDRCQSEDMRTREVRKALRELAKVITNTWPIDQFFKALHQNNEAGRWQLANAALNEIRTYVTR